MTVVDTNLTSQIEEVADLLWQLINDHITWNDIYAQYPHQDQPQD